MGIIHIERLYHMTMLRLIYRLFEPSKPNLYRIVRYGNGYEPQMSYSAGMVKGLFWYPMNADGYWLEPDAFNEGRITMHIAMTKPEDMWDRFPQFQKKPGFG